MSGRFKRGALDGAGLTVHLEQFLSEVQVAARTKLLAGS